jgi:hypothetical protein
MTGCETILQTYAHPLRPRHRMLDVESAVGELILWQEVDWNIFGDQNGSCDIR